MSPTFQSIYRELEQQRTEILTRISDLSSEKFNHNPAPGKWSLAQVLTHILIAEQLSLAYMEKKMLGISQLKNSGLSEAVRLGILKIVLRIPSLKFKAPAVVVRNTPSPLSVEELIIRWEAHHLGLKTFLDKIDDKDEKKLLYKHPGAGRLNARQAMVSFREHIIHHWPQINRLLNRD